jgi:transposase-like protein
MSHEPKTLQEAIEFFADETNVNEYLIVRRWADGVVRCPRCGSEDVLFQAKYNRYQCSKKHSLRQFTLKTGKSLKTGTIFEDSPVPLKKWLLATCMVVNCKNGVSSYEIHRAIGVTQKTAWFMDHRIRFALHLQTPEDQMGGEGSTVEADETYISGLARNMHKDKRKARFQGRTGGYGKVAVFGLLESNSKKGQSKIKVQVIPDLWKETVSESQRDGGAEDEHLYRWARRILPARNSGIQPCCRSPRRILRGRRSSHERD